MNNDSMMINYALSPDREGPGFFRDLIVAHNARCVLEVGSGANPLLPPTFVRERGIAYITSDIDPTELAKADPVYEAVLLDLTVPIADPALLGRFDLVFSTMVGEHIPDAPQLPRQHLPSPPARRLLRASLRLALDAALRLQQAAA